MWKPSKLDPLRFAADKVGRDALESISRAFHQADHGLVLIADDPVNTGHHDARSCVIERDFYLLRLLGGLLGLKQHVAQPLGGIGDRFAFARQRGHAGLKAAVRIVNHAIHELSLHPRCAL